MLNDKLIIEMSCNYIYRIPELKNSKSSLNKYLTNHYPDIKIIDIQEPFADSTLNVICIQDIDSRDVAIIFQGSSNLDDWRNDNLNNFLNKNVLQYEAALQYYQHIESSNNRITYLGGNSLGGGCAQYVALNHPHVRALCINASPLTKSNYMDTNNIINIRVSADPLYRCVMLDNERYENGYVGQIYIVDRSLYGSYDYYNCIELAHRGSIIFPYNYLYNNYKVKNMDELKNVISPKKYHEYSQLRVAPTLSQFMTFDLISNNIDKSVEFDLDELQDNFANRIKEINKSLLEYHIPNLESKIGNPFMKINDCISDSLKAILKYSLLHVTKQEEKLYDNIYFIIEKSTNYFYKLISQSLNEINEAIDADSTTHDYEKIINDIQTNKDSINTIIDSLILINNELYDFDKFSIKKALFPPKIKEFNNNVQQWSLDYNKIVYDKIDTVIEENISKNRLFIEQLEKMISAALIAKKISLQLPFGNKKTIAPEDIDYILERYNLNSIIQEALNIFKKDIHEEILSQSLFYIYQSNMICINEQLQQLQKTIFNLKFYISSLPKNNNKKNLENAVLKVENYINNLIEFNNSSII